MGPWKLVELFAGYARRRRDEALIRRRMRRYVGTIRSA
jgi:hypothetical protein